MDRGSGSPSRWEYTDFELEIREGGPHEYPVAVRSLAAGEAEERMRFPFDEWELQDKLKDLEIALLRSGGRRRRMPSREERTVQEFGQALFESLLVGDVRTCYERSLDKARQQNKGLRMKLRIQPPKLTGLPWEFLYDEGQGEYLCLSSETPLVRYVDLRRPIEQLPVSPPLNILGMVANPLDLEPLDVENEKRLVEEAIMDLRTEGLVELTWLEKQTWRDLQRAMRRGWWHIFHFIGHGDFDPATDEGRIAFSDEAGRKHLLKARHLARLLDDHHPLRLVFLNSCEGAQGSEGDPFSSTAATLVHRGVPAVVAMQYEISDKVAIEFSRSFYEAVADGLPVDAAVAEARTAVSMDSALEWGTPVLYMRSPDGRIFDVSTEDVFGAAPPVEPIQEETEDREEEESLRQYREFVEWVWVDGQLHGREVERLNDLANNQLGLSPSAAADIERGVMGDTKEAILERQTRDREENERHNRLDELYTQARRLHRDQEWQAVVDLFDQIHELDPEYPDHEGLLTSAHEELAAREELMRKVAAAYDRGLRHIEAEEWSQALQRFEEIQRLRSGYRDTESLLSQMRDKLVKPQTVEVPDLRGQSTSQARSMLENRGLKLDTQNQTSSETIPEGKIVRQSPEAGTEVEPDSLVTVTVSLGPLTVEVPDLTGLGLTQAQSKLTGVGLKIDGKNDTPCDDMPEGSIIKQHPVAGTKAKQGSPVRVTLSSGPQIENNTGAGPDSSGRTLREAGRTLPSPDIELLLALTRKFIEFIGQWKRKEVFLSAGAAAVLGGVLWVLFPLGAPIVDNSPTYYRLMAIPLVLMLIGLGKLITLHRQAFRRRTLTVSVSFFSFFTALMLLLTSSLTDAEAISNLANTAPKDAPAFFIGLLLLIASSIPLGLTIMRTAVVPHSRLGGWLLGGGFLFNIFLVFLVDKTVGFGTPSFLWAVTAPYGFALAVLGQGLLSVKDAPTRSEQHRPVEADSSSDSSGQLRSSAEE